MNRDDSLERARARARELRGFYSTAVLYVVVNAFLFVIDMLTEGGPWFYWPLLGWGIGMAGYAIYVFGLGGLFGQDWEDRKTREIMERQERKRP